MTHQLNRVETLTARKRHGCVFCLRWITAGERYVRFTGFSADGDFNSSAYCLGCDVAWRFHDRFLGHDWHDCSYLAECLGEDDHIIAAALQEGIKNRWWTDRCGQCRVCYPDWHGMFLCATCGNKRCPHATDCRLVCTGSNEPGQPGSVYR